MLRRWLAGSSPLRSARGFGYDEKGRKAASAAEGGTFGVRFSAQVDVSKEERHAVAKLTEGQWFAAPNTGRQRRMGADRASISARRSSMRYFPLSRLDFE
jgi:hypothetical protein